MRIRTKLFAVLLMLTLAMVAGMLGFTQWSFEQGFAQLVERRQADRIERVRANLIEHYESFGDWGAMRNDVSHWLQALGRQQRPARQTGSSRRASSLCQDDRVLSTPHR